MILHRYPSDRHSRLIDCLSSTVVAVWGTAIICRNDAAMCGTASPFGTLCPSIDRTLEQLAGGNAIQSARHHRKQFIGLQPGAETWNARAWRTMHRCGVSTNHLTDFARDVLITSFSMDMLRRNGMLLPFRGLDVMVLSVVTLGKEARSGFAMRGS